MSVGVSSVALTYVYTLRMMTHECTMFIRYPISNAPSDHYARTSTRRKVRTYESLFDFTLARHRNVLLSIPQRVGTARAWGAWVMKSIRSRTICVFIYT